MPEQLKIIIDADVNKAIAGVQNLSKVLTSDFIKATDSASLAASNLSKDVANSILKINSSLAGFKVTSLDLSVNTSQIDSAIQSIKAKFATLVDPKIDILANSAQAEATIKDLISDISLLKGSEIFIRANDTQALKVLNEVEAELNQLVGKDISLNVTANLSKLEELKTKLASIKVAPIDVSVNDSTINASIKNIQSKFAAIIDPELNVLANTELAEVKIKELLADLSALQDSEVFIRANDTQALGKIQEIKTELGSLLDRQIHLNVNTTEATNKLASLEKELLDLQSLSINPDITTTQLAVFEANIKRVKDEIASLKGEAVVIPIKVPPIPPNVIKSINDLEKELSELKTKIDFSTDINEIKRLGDEFRRVEGQISNIKISGNLSGQLDKIGLAGKRAADNLKNLPKASGAATQSLINLGRVAQDAPFGIIGIANNINPLLESFQRLRAESTSTSAAFKAFGASLIGGGGIGFGVSIVTSLLTQFALSNRGAKEENDKWAKSIQINTDAVIKKQEDFSKAIDAAAKSVLSQADSLTDLNKLLTTTSSKIDDITDATIRQGVASVLFDKKNIETQRLLNAEIEKGLKARIFTPGASLIPEFDPDAFSKDPLTKQAAQATQQLKIINSLSTGLEDIFKKLLSTGKKGSDDFGKIQDEIIARARQFVKEFGDSFVLPNLEDSFFSSKDQLFKASVNLLATVKKELSKQAALTDLEIKLPVLFTTETRLDDSDLKKFLRGEITREQVKEFRIRVPIVTDLDIQLSESLIKEFEPTKDLIDSFFKSIQIERDIPIEVTPDLTLAKGSLDKIDQKLDLRKQFSVLGDIGLKEFSKIDFTNINEGIAEATKRLQGMMDIANTLNQAIGQGLSNAFNAVFDAVLEGKSVFKALSNAVKELIVTTIKAVAQMLILKAITSILLPGSAGAKVASIPNFFRARFGEANFSGFGGIGSSAFSNVIQVVVSGQLSGSDINLAGQRAANSSGRFG